MTSRDFAYWLQGLFELSDVTSLNEKQTDLIRRHLALFFIHEIDPSMGDKPHQDTLNNIHNWALNANELPDTPPPFFPIPLDNSNPFITTGIKPNMKFRC